MAETLRLYIERKEGRDAEAQDLTAEIRSALGLMGLDKIRLITEYEVAGLTADQLNTAAPGLFYEPPSDIAKESLTASGPVIAREYLPGQFDQRADSAARGLRLLYPDRTIEVRRADIIIPVGNLSEEDFNRIRDWVINPVDSRVKILGESSLGEQAPLPESIPVLKGFRKLDDAGLKRIKKEEGLALEPEDLEFIRTWFAENEQRDPTLAELRALDTYWSDHCRHTTFETELLEIEVADGPEADEIQAALKDWEAARASCGRKEKPRTLMDLATVAARCARSEGTLEDWDISEEINACTLKVNADIDGKRVPWLLSFKNETHNHPTEIEPYGGASTCLGGAVRDPLSGRAYVHQALRVTGGADPRQNPRETRKGKLPQRLIAHGAAEGYSGYGNQLGLATTIVREHYHPLYEAKRLECGAVMAACPAANVVREVPQAGDAVILVGGKTGRDGIGGATGSSVAHDGGSLEKAGAEVQKGNAPEERKIQRLFRNPQASKLIRRCNDFGAGGVAVAVGELADGLEINLDAVPVKYSGLNGLELALSESQERMAVVVSPEDAETFIGLAAGENLEAVAVARVTDDRRLRMNWRGDTIIDLDRDLLDTAGVRRTAKAFVPADTREDGGSREPGAESRKAGAEKSGGERCEGFGGACGGAADLLSVLCAPEIASRRGLEERFDGTVGGGTVLAPHGGFRQAVPAEASVHLLPADGEVGTAGIMSIGFDPALASMSPFRGGQYALIEALARMCAAGGPWRKARFSLQEFFGRTDKGPEAWGRPLAALLGALTVQRRWNLPAIGGKDSMSGSFEELDVPPTMIAFAAAAMEAKKAVGASLPGSGLTLVLVNESAGSGGGPETFSAPDFDVLAAGWDWIGTLNERGVLQAGASVGPGGALAKLAVMALGNLVGVELDDEPGAAPERTKGTGPFAADYGALIIAVEGSLDGLLPEAAERGVRFRVLGKTIDEAVFKWPGGGLTLDEIEAAWRRPFSEVWPEDRRDGERIAPAQGVPGDGRICGEDPLGGPGAALGGGGGALLGEGAPVTPEDGDVLLRWNRREKSSCDFENGGARRASGAGKPRVLIPVFSGTNGEDDARRAFSRAGAAAEECVFLDRVAGCADEAIKGLAERIGKSQILYISGGFSAGDEPDGAGKYIAAVLRQERVADAIHSLLERDGLILGICNGFQALIKSGWLISGEAGVPGSDDPTLVRNRIGRHVARVVRTVATGARSPWLSRIFRGDVHCVPVSHGEGRFTAPKAVLDSLAASGRIAFQYCDREGRPSMGGEFNPNGSDLAVEGLLSPCGRILGKMGHSERWRKGTLIDIPGMETEQPLIAGGVDWFR